MKERPIIFNTEMVRAILDGRKTQTRRLIKFGVVGDRLWVRETFAVLGNEDGVPIDWNNTIVLDVENAIKIYRASCEIRDGDYGLWSIPDDADWKPHTDNLKYEGGWKSSIHMPRWASRLTLEITNVRVERIHDISEDDAKAEGFDSVMAFRRTWENIYGSDSWDCNPWVWVIDFKVV